MREKKEGDGDDVSGKATHFLLLLQNLQRQADRGSDQWVKVKLRVDI